MTKETKEFAFIVLVTLAICLALVGVLWWFVAYRPDLPCGGPLSGLKVTSSTLSDIECP